MVRTDLRSEATWRFIVCDWKCIVVCISCVVVMSAWIGYMKFIDRQIDRDCKRLQEEMDKKCDEAGLPRMKVTKH